MASTPTFYIEGDSKDEYMVIEGLSASEAACYYKAFYGKEPRHMRKLTGRYSFPNTHKSYRVSVPEGSKLIPRTEEWV